MHGCGGCCCCCCCCESQRLWDSTTDNQSKFSLSLSLSLSLFFSHKVFCLFEHTYTCCPHTAEITDNIAVHSTKLVYLTHWHKTTTNFCRRSPLPPEAKRNYVAVVYIYIYILYIYIRPTIICCLANNIYMHVCGEFCYIAGIIMIITHLETQTLQGHCLVLLYFTLVTNKILVSVITL